ncbi:ABC transporter substrate-binding protein [Desulfovibrio sp. JC022]|uniref:substrate-binding periplasmic protein n=1 Tax=Desulfovibrio sp. JC022 TaxID=2593642 RepID=UPI0013CFA051|nr:transporter substrate-binding domain-containing protein [Desulfovibrio sp. JC022]NDV24778.1 transporter substrate-binding domain-containing protein [Desulfovibrio sp. JC022]
MLNKIFATLLIIASMLTLAHKGHAVERVTVYGDKTYAPFCFMHNGTYDGIYVRILTKAFSRMDGYNVEIKPLPWKRALRGLEKGKIFAMFPPYYRPKLRPWIDIYSTPILEEGYELYCRKEIFTKPRPNWPQDYQDLQIGTNLGYAVPQINGIALQETASSIQNAKKLMQGKIDCYASNNISTIYLLKKMGADLSMFKKGVKISLEYSYLAFSNKNNPSYKKDFIRQFNEVINKMKKDNEIKAIVDEFIH